MPPEGDSAVADGDLSRGQELDDLERLAALRALGLLDTPTAEPFTTYVRLASRLTGAPVALVSLVEEERQFFAATLGFGQPPLMETPIAHSFCQHVVRSGDVFKVDDSRTHPLVAFNPAVEELGFAAYLGAPVRHPAGHVLGAICVIADEPRQWTADDAEVLRDLARLVDREIADLHTRLAQAPPGHAQQALVLDMMNDAVIVTDAKRRVTEWNRAAEQLFGFTRDQVVGRPRPQFQHPGDDVRLGPELRAALRDYDRWSGEYRILRPDGEERMVESEAVQVRGPDGRTLASMSISRDITERRRVEVAMLKAQRMESLGQLAGGLAHDFNNLLTAILGSVSLAHLSDEPLHESTLENLETIETAARRGADITRRLMSFARGELTRLATLDLAEVVQDVIRIARPSVPRTIDMTMSTNGYKALVEGDATQLQQALLNIVLNAAYVMPRGGRITFDVRALEDAPSPVASVSIADTGPGMEESVRERVFEPFFTTKPQGLGTGLGLASTYGIVTGFGGAVRVESVLGEGTTFHIELPLAFEAPVPETPLEVEGETGPILVVDDEDIVRRATSSMLRGFGLEVVEVASGRAAVEMVQAAPRRWAAVILDLVMPGYSGAECFRDISRINPDLPVIIASGYAPESYLEDGDRRRVSAVLQKPFTMARLREVLESIGVPVAARGD